MFGRKIIAELAEIDEDLVRSQLTPARGLRDLPPQGDL
jgi:hypothetical protein